MNTNRTSMVIILTFYLIALAFFLGAIGSDIGEINYTTTGQNVGNTISFLGMDISVGGGFIGNIVLGVASMPLWLNTLLIILPATLLVVFTALMFIPTIPSG